MPKVTFLSTQIELQVIDGSEWADILRKYPEAPLKFGCRAGDCGVCAIRIHKGYENLTKCSPAEQATLQAKGLDCHYRLACQCAINGPVVVET